MPVPTHGDYCSTRLWPTSCPDCSSQVYFFSCSCGSRVLFDLSEPPWNPHEDRCIPYLVRFLRDSAGHSAAAIRGLIEAFAQERSLRIPPDVDRFLRAAENRERGSSTVLDILPSDEETPVLGTVESINQVNIFRRFSIAPSVMGRAMLGRLAEIAQAEVAVREGRDPDTGFVNRFTFLVPLKVFERARIRQGQVVTVALLGHKLANGRRVWITDEIHRVTKLTE